jgi:signal peptidase I
MRFEEILVTLTAVTGAVVLVNYIYLKKFAPITNGSNVKQNWAIETCKSFFPVFLIVLVLRSFFFEAFRIPSGSMKPTLVEGDFIIVNKYTYGVRLPILGTQLIPLSKPKAGDIIVFRHTDGKDLIKRVVGVPGDHIQYKDKQLFINGEIVPTDFYQPTHDGHNPAVESTEHLNNIVHNIYVYPHIKRIYSYDDIVVPANSYFVLGDNRDNSEDGRYWGFVPDKDLLGKAVATWMSWDGNNHDIRWSRIGRSVYTYASEKIANEAVN